MRRSSLHLLTESGELLQEADGSLIQFVDDFVLADILEPRVLKYVEFELTVQAVVSHMHVCVVCNAPSSKKCSGCRLARYCSRECQMQDWQEHKTHCAPR